MQVSVETISELDRKMTIRVPEEEIQEQIASRLRSLSHKVKIDGFRPGKVPPSVIKKRYGQQIRDEVLADLIQSSFYDAVRDGQLRPAGTPEIKAQKADEGQGLEYEASFEVLPEFVPMPLESLAVNRFVSEVTESDVDAMIERLREQRLTWRPVERSAAAGDRLVIAFEGRLGEEIFTNGREENFPVVIGSKQMIPGFEDRLLGSEVGGKLDFELDFPSDYPGEKLAGKTGRFLVDVTAVEESVWPSLDSEFVKSFGVESGDVSDFRADIRGNMEREMRRALATKTKTAVMDVLLQRNAVSLPGVLVKDELNELMAPSREQARSRNHVLDEGKLTERLKPMAERRVALALILGRIIDAYRLVVDPKRVRATIEELAAGYEDPAEVVRWYYAEKERLKEVENLTLEDQVVELILEKAQTSEHQVAFSDLMQPNAASA
jgi:trigger factor